MTRTIVVVHRPRDCNAKPRTNNSFVSPSRTYGSYADRQFVFEARIPCVQSPNCSKMNIDLILDLLSAFGFQNRTQNPQFVIGYHIFF